MLRILRSVRAAALAVLLLVPPALAQDTAEEKIEKADTLRKTGRAAEAVELYDSVIGQAETWDDPVLLQNSWYGRALARAEIGGRNAAKPGLEWISARFPENADIPATLAEWAFESGERAEAKRLSELALKIDPNHVRGRWVDLRLMDTEGRRDEATAAAEWFIKRRNDAPDAFSAEDLVIAGQAAERFYRASTEGEQLAESLSDIITELYDAAVDKDPNCWQAHWSAGKLFLAGYNEKRAIPELQKALRINPLAAPVIVTPNSTVRQMVSATRHVGSDIGSCGREMCV